MHSFSEITHSKLVIPNHEELLRELLSLDALCPISCVFKPGPYGGFDRELAPSPLHWSRNFEWPWAIHHSELQKHHRVLDIGGGWCVLKYALADRCQEVISLEVNEEFINKTEPSIKKLGRKNIKQVLGDVRNIPFPDASFDRVFCISVLEHVPNQHTQAIQEMMRVLKPGGALILTLDMRMEGSNQDNFYLSNSDVDNLCTQFHIPKWHHPSDSTLTCARFSGGLTIIAFLARLAKYNNGF